MEGGAKTAIANAVVARETHYVISGLESVLERVSLVIRQHVYVIHTAHLEVTALTVPSNALAVWAHATVLLVHVEMVAVKTDGQE
ncbi:hypothetical protein DPMN_107287 [Dreissena polymorpha]|uniref:Uncharacterized protein n=1 Tax=Dreissena polymorpha TaxID=45954 RepID=A0A9D4QK07_DREPO|nr:hypothetical protein DPMN_107287 [Dreissena polymorpha]